MSNASKNLKEPGRKPRVALMGEFSAGKSTLSNMLLDGAPFPVRVTATRLPPVWTSYGKHATVVVDHDGTEKEIDVAALTSVSLEETSVIRHWKTTELLELCDLIDMPGISDPNLPVSTWISTLDEVDFVVWCTHATQAWRQSEAAIWEQVMPATNGRNILLVTQIDKIAAERDRNRVLARVRQETEGLFEGVYPVSILQAMKADESQNSLRDSGVEAFLEHFIENLLKSASQDQTKNVTRVIPSEPPKPRIRPAVAVSELADTSQAVPDQDAQSLPDAIAAEQSIRQPQVRRNVQIKHPRSARPDPEQRT